MPTSPSNDEIFRTLSSIRLPAAKVHAARNLCNPFVSALSDYRDPATLRYLSTQCRRLLEVSGTLCSSTDWGMRMAGAAMSACVVPAALECCELVAQTKGLCSSSSSSSSAAVVPLPSSFDACLMIMGGGSLLGPKGGVDVIGTSHGMPTDSVDDVEGMEGLLSFTNFSMDDLIARGEPLLAYGIARADAAEARFWQSGETPPPTTASKNGPESGIGGKASSGQLKANANSSSSHSASHSSKSSSSSSSASSSLSTSSNAPFIRQNALVTLLSSQTREAQERRMLLLQRREVMRILGMAAAEAEGSGGGTLHGSESGSGSGIMSVDDRVSKKNSSMRGRGSSSSSSSSLDALGSGSSHMNEDDHEGAISSLGKQGLSNHFQNAAGPAASKTHVEVAVEAYTDMSQAITDKDLLSVSRAKKPAEAQAAQDLVQARSIMFSKDKGTRRGRKLEPESAAEGEKAVPSSISVKAGAAAITASTSPPGLNATPASSPLPDSSVADEDVYSPLVEALESTIREWVGDLLFSMFHPTWMDRHGAALALRDTFLALLRLDRSPSARARRAAALSSGSSIERDEGIIHTTRSADAVPAVPVTVKYHSALLIDVVIRCVGVLSLDRFGDYAGDGLIAPVRAIVAQVLALCITHSKQQRDILQTILLLEKLTRHKEWHVRHGCMLGLRAVITSLITLKGEYAEDSVATHASSFSSSSSSSSSSNSSAASLKGAGSRVEAVHGGTRLWDALHTTRMALLKTILEDAHEDVCAVASDLFLKVIEAAASDAVEGPPIAEIQGEPGSARSRSAARSSSIAVVTGGGTLQLRDGSSGGDTGQLNIFSRWMVSACSNLDDIRYTALERLKICRSDMSTLACSLMKLVASCTLSSKEELTSSTLSAGAPYSSSSSASSSSASSSSASPPLVIDEVAHGRMVAETLSAICRFGHHASTDVRTASALALAQLVQSEFSRVQRHSTLNEEFGEQAAAKGSRSKKATKSSTSALPSASASASTPIPGFPGGVPPFAPSWRWWLQIGIPCALRAAWRVIVLEPGISSRAVEQVDIIADNLSTLQRAGGAGSRTAAAAAQRASAEGLSELGIDASLFGSSALSGSEGSPMSADSEPIIDKGKLLQAAAVQLQSSSTALRLLVDPAWNGALQPWSALFDTDSSGVAAAIDGAATSPPLLAGGVDERAMILSRASFERLEILSNARKALQTCLSFYSVCVGINQASPSPLEICVLDWAWLRSAIDTLSVKDGEGAWTQALAIPLIPLEAHSAVAALTMQSDRLGAAGAAAKKMQGKYAAFGKVSSNAHSSAADFSSGKRTRGKRDVAASTGSVTREIPSPSSLMTFLKESSAKRASPHSAGTAAYASLVREEDKLDVNDFLVSSEDEFEEMDAGNGGVASLNDPSHSTQASITWSSASRGGGAGSGGAARKVEEQPYTSSSRSRSAGATVLGEIIATLLKAPSPVKGRSQLIADLSAGLHSTSLCRVETSSQVLCSSILAAPRDEGMDEGASFARGGTKSLPPAMAASSSAVVVSLAAACQHWGVDPLQREAVDSSTVPSGAPSQSAAASISGGMGSSSVGSSSAASVFFAVPDELQSLAHHLRLASTELSYSMPQKDAAATGSKKSASSKKVASLSSTAAASSSLLQSVVFNTSDAAATVSWAEILHCQRALQDAKEVLLQNEVVAQAKAAMKLSRVASQSDGACRDRISAKSSALILSQSTSSSPMDATVLEELALRITQCDASMEKFLAAWEIAQRRVKGILSLCCVSVHLQQLRCSSSMIPILSMRPGGGTLSSSSSASLIPNPVSSSGIALMPPQSSLLIRSLVDCINQPIPSYLHCAVGIVLGQLTKVLASDAATARIAEKICDKITIVCGTAMNELEAILLRKRTSRADALIYDSLLSYPGLLGMLAVGPASVLQNYSAVCGTLLRHAIQQRVRVPDSLAASAITAGDGRGGGGMKHDGLENAPTGAPSSIPPLVISLDSTLVAIKNLTGMVTVSSSIFSADFGDMLCAAAFACAAFACSADPRFSCLAAPSRDFLSNSASARLGPTIFIIWERILPWMNGTAQSGIVAVPLDWHCREVGGGTAQRKWRWNLVMMAAGHLNL